MRRIAINLFALLVIGIGGSYLGGVEAAQAAPVAQYRTYYDAWGNVVGEGMWNCQGQYVQFWGIATSNFTSEEISCDIDPQVQV